MQRPEVRAAMKGRRLSPEAREKISAVMRVVMQCPEMRAAIKYRRSWMLNPEVRAKISAAARKPR